MADTLYQIIGRHRAEPERKPAQKRQPSDAARPDQAADKLQHVAVVLIAAGRFDDLFHICARTEPNEVHASRAEAQTAGL